MTRPPSCDNGDPALYFTCTTINADATALHRNLQRWPDPNRCVIAFDRKTRYTQILDARAQWIEFSHTPVTDYERLCPWDSYSRKNIAFLHAAQSGAAFIFETDDDNQLTASYDYLAKKTAIFDEDFEAASTQGPVNLFAGIYLQERDNIWARGYPLKHIDARLPTDLVHRRCRPGIIQFLVDGNPDVDAIFRLVRGADLDMQVDLGNLPIGIVDSYHPFNSQATLWPRDMFSLMYLPSSCPFRMTDIWRSYVAQRILYELGRCVVFEAPIVRQVRNTHAIHDDFFDELPGYQQSEMVIDTLLDINLGDLGQVSDMLCRCYAKLQSIGIVDKRELVLIKAWLEAVQ
jgi:hypothetical protein